MANPQHDFVLKTIDKRDIHFVRLWFTDVLGNLKSFAITPVEVEDAFAEGIGFDGSAVEGFADVDESDMLAYPDASTFQGLPWRPTTNGVARMFCDIRTTKGEPCPGDPRNALKNMLRRAGKLGYTMNVGPEMEFYYVKSAEDPTPLDNGGYFDLTSSDSGSDLRRDTVLTLEKLGIIVEYSHHEAGPAQQEIHLRYSDALTMADNVMTYRLAVEQIARMHGVCATFMPKPFEGKPGSAMHVHQSLFTEEGDNAFFDQNDPLGYNLSDTAKHYMAGLIAYAPEYMAVTNQHVNSYKRLVAGDDVPNFAAWSHASRAAMIRVPAYKPGKALACRIELRTPDPCCNPYLAFAAMLGAGLAGIEQKLELPREFGHGAVTDAPTLPSTLGEAIERFERSDLMRDVLGDHIFDYFVQAKHAEWEEYCSYVSPWEMRRHLSGM